MIKLKVKDILKEKNISKYELNKHINISPNNLTRMLNNETTSIKFEYIEAFCKYFDCTPNDIFEINYEDE